MTDSRKHGYLAGYLAKEAEMWDDPRVKKPSDGAIAADAGKIGLDKTLRKYPAQNAGEKEWQLQNMKPAAIPQKKQVAVPNVEPQFKGLTGDAFKNKIKELLTKYPAQNPSEKELQMELGADIGRPIPKYMTNKQLAGSKKLLELKALK